MGLCRTSPAGHRAWTARVAALRRLKAGGVGSRGGGFRGQAGHWHLDSEELPIKEKTLECTNRIFLACNSPLLGWNFEGLGWPLCGRFSLCTDFRSGPVLTNHQHLCHLETRSCLVKKVVFGCILIGTLHHRVVAAKFTSWFVTPGP